MEPLEYRTLLDRDALSKGLDELGERLVARFSGQELTVVAILGGAVIFAADLMRRLPPGIVMDFMRIQTYGDRSSPDREARADWIPHRGNIEGKTVLLLDDILDTGRTMKEARRVLVEELGADRVHVVVLVDKPVRRAVDVIADDRVILLEEDLFLVGYGLDLGGRYRNLPELLALDVPEGASLTGATIQPKA